MPFWPLDYWRYRLLSFHHYLLLLVIPNFSQFAKLYQKSVRLAHCSIPQCSPVPITEEIVTCVSHGLLVEVDDGGVIGQIGDAPDAGIEVGSIWVEWWVWGHDWSPGSECSTLQA